MVTLVIAHPLLINPRLGLVSARRLSLKLSPRRQAMSNGFGQNPKSQTVYGGPTIQTKEGTVYNGPVARRPLYQGPAATTPYHPSLQALPSAPRPGSAGARQGSNIFYLSAAF